MLRYKFILLATTLAFVGIGILLSCGDESDLVGAYDDVVEPDTKGPVLIEFFPEPGDTWVSVLQPIVLRFNEDIDPATVNVESFRITPNVYAERQTCRTEIACTVWSKMDWNTTYEVAVATSVADTSGNRIPSEISWSFTTRFRPPPPVITGFTPSSGVINSPVTIHGTGFDSVRYENRVWFNADTSFVVRSNDSMIHTVVPTTATSGPIIVENQTAADTSDEPFTVLPAPPPLGGRYRGSFTQIDRFNTTGQDSTVHYVTFVFYPTVYVMYLDTSVQDPSSGAVCDMMGSHTRTNGGILIEVDLKNFGNRDCDTSIHPEGFYGATKFGDTLYMVEYLPYYRRVKELRLTPY